MAEQTQRSSPGCTKGGKEAQELFQQALNYHHGLNGMSYDVEKAIKFYEESLALGNPKAAINLGTLYRTAFATHQESRATRLEYMNALYKYATELGCPDGYYFLALSSYEGWGVKQSKRDGDAYIQKGLEAGSLPCMASHGLSLKESGNREEAKKWLRKAVDGGFGLAAHHLFITFWVEKNYPAMIDALRIGAKLGDSNCLYSLFNIYGKGADGQPQDKEYARCFWKLYKSINDEAPPPLFENFDELCPPREVIPYNAKDHSMPPEEEF